MTKNGRFNIFSGLVALAASVSTACGGVDGENFGADESTAAEQAASIPASWTDLGISSVPSFAWDIACTFHPLNTNVNCAPPPANADDLWFPTNQVAGYLDPNVGFQTWRPNSMTIVSNRAAASACIYVLTTANELYRTCGNPKNQWPGPNGDFGNFTEICEPKDTSGNALAFASNKMVTIRYFVPFGLAVSIGMVALATDGKIYGCNTTTKRWAQQTTRAFSGLPSKTWTDISSGISMDFFLKAGSEIWVRPRGTQDGRGNVTYPAPYKAPAVKDGSTTLTVSSMAYPYVLTTNYKIYKHDKSNNTWRATNVTLPSNRTSMRNIVDASQFFGQASIGVLDSSSHTQVRGM